MRRTRLELWLATTAIAVVAAGLSLPAQSAPLTEDEISAAVPMPESANLPPPTISDIAPLAPVELPKVAAPPRAASPAATSDAPQPAATPAMATPEIAKPEASPAGATPAAAAPTEAPVLTIDQRVAEKLREMFSGKIERFIDRKIRPPLRHSTPRIVLRRFGSKTASRTRAPKLPQPISPASARTALIRATIQSRALRTQSRAPWRKPNSSSPPPS